MNQLNDMKESYTLELRGFHMNSEKTNSERFDISTLLILAVGSIFLCDFLFFNFGYKQINVIISQVIIGIGIYYMGKKEVTKGLPKKNDIQLSNNLILVIILLILITVFLPLILNRHQGDDSNSISKGLLYHYWDIFAALVLLFNVLGFMYYSKLVLVTFQATNEIKQTTNETFSQIKIQTSINLLDSLYSLNSLIFESVFREPKFFASIYGTNGLDEDVKIAFKNQLNIKEPADKIRIKLLARQYSQYLERTHALIYNIFSSQISNKEKIQDSNMISKDDLNDWIYFIRKMFDNSEAIRNEFLSDIDGWDKRLLKLFEPTVDNLYKKDKTKLDKFKNRINEKTIKTLLDLLQECKEK